MIDKEALKEEVLEAAIPVNRLKPVLMVGVYGDYRFSNEGVKITPADEFISTDKCEEAAEALEIWEEYYSQTTKEV